MSRKKIISVILAHLMLLVCVTACQAASPRQTAQSQAADRQASEGDFLGYLGLENMGMFTCAGDVKESVLEEIRKMAASL